MKRLLFRVTRGKAMLQTFPLEVSDQDVLMKDDFHTSRLGYIVLFEDQPVLRRTVLKTCQSFLGPVFETPMRNIMDELRTAKAYKAQMRDIIVTSKRQTAEWMNNWNPLKGNGNVSVVQVYKQFLVREKTIYKTLNMFKQCNSLLVGLVWVPAKYEQDFIEKKNQMSQSRGLTPIIQIRSADEELTKPTYFESNEFSEVFQQIVDTYGIPTYKEANPAVFACVTFPFLFGVMFGDVFAGSILLAFGIYLNLAPRGKGGLVDLFAQGRYFVVLMGIFSLFCGFIYNDYTSLPLYLFGSCYTYTPGVLEPTLQENCVYPIGVDPAWYLSPNELTFMNSMKMKIAVIFGVAQMSLGIFLKGSNALYHRSVVDFVFEFLPQIFMLIALFGFMDYLIIIKWLTNYEGHTGDAPSIITTMIDMCLGVGVPAPNNHESPLFETQELQTQIMQILLLVVILCVPLMLCVKPIWASVSHKSHEKVGDDFARAEPSESDADQPFKAGNSVDIFNLREDILATLGVKEEGANHSFGEAMIHQLIETIEFVLGTVSNTASYLRLWALSLAHSQLAKVFFDNTLITGFQSGSFVALFLGFFAFMGATFGVLLCMDLMECFLHTLRLHWVEFQNKFYKGNGVLFQPTSIKKAL